MSKKSKLTAERWKIITGGIRDGYTVSDACKMACIGRSTYYKWLDEFPDFNKAIVEATDLQWKYADYMVRHGGYRGYKRHLNRPSPAYQSPNNVPFEIPSVEPEAGETRLVDLESDEELWWKWSRENAY